MALDLYLQVEGVTGESQDANHQGWIDIASFAWGASQRGTMASGGGGGAGKVQFRDLQVAANLDKATSALLKFCASGKHVGQVKLSFCKAGGKQMEYVTVVLKDVLVTRVSMENPGMEQEVVNYSFQAAEVEQHYWVQMKDGGRGAECAFGWNIKENKATA